MGKHLGPLLAAVSSQEGGHGDDRGRLFSEGHRDSLKGNGLKLQYGTLPEGQRSLFSSACLPSEIGPRPLLLEIFPPWSNLM